MKKIVFIIVLSVSLNGYSQMAVTDATANATLSGQLTTASSSLTQLQRTYAAIKAASEKLEKVNTAIKSVNKMGEVIEMQQEALNNIDFYIAQTKKINGKVDVKKVGDIIANMTSLIGDLNKVLTSSFFNMTDKERVDYFTERKQEVTTELLKTRMLKIMTTR
jgi:hypothetical protein